MELPIPITNPKPCPSPVDELNSEPLPLGNTLLSEPLPVNDEIIYNDAPVMMKQPLATAPLALNAVAQNSNMTSYQQHCTTSYQQHQSANATCYPQHQCTTGYYQNHSLCSQTQMFAQHPGYMFANANASTTVQQQQQQQHQHMHNNNNNSNIHNNNENQQNDEPDNNDQEQFLDFAFFPVGYFAPDFEKVQESLPFAPEDCFLDSHPIAPFTEDSTTNATQTSENRVPHNSLNSSKATAASNSNMLSHPASHAVAKPSTAHATTSPLNTPPSGIVAKPSQVRATVGLPPSLNKTPSAVEKPSTAHKSNALPSSLNKPRSPVPPKPSTIPLNKPLPSAVHKTVTAPPLSKHPLPSVVAKPSLVQPTVAQPQSLTKPLNKQLKVPVVPSKEKAKKPKKTTTKTLAQHERFKPFHEEKWNDRFKELQEFVKENGHGAVPHTYPQNPVLARWVKRQRRQYKLRNMGQTSTMTTERLDQLNSVKFIWDSHEVAWHEKREALKVYRKIYGDCNVQANYSDKKLATWVKCQRRQYKLYWQGKSSAMSPDRICQLEELGFEWEIRLNPVETGDDPVDELLKQKMSDI